MGVLISLLLFLTGCYPPPEPAVRYLPARVPQQCDVLTVLNVNRCSFQPQLCPSPPSAYCSVVVGSPHGQEYLFACNVQVGSRYERCL